MYKLLFILFLIVIIFSLTNNYKINEKYTNNNDETFTNALITSFKIINTKKTLEYNNNNYSAIVGQTIYFELNNNLNGKKYILIRYPDFRNEQLRHSKQNFLNYFNHLKKNIINQNNNYIFDFTGFHAIIDDKVRLWIKLKDSYGRNIANTVMPKTYLIPNDKDIFLQDYQYNKKYILKNSFGGARSALTITKSKDDILQYFNTNYNAYKCEDPVCHSSIKYNIIQEFIEPTFLINGHKFGVRMYIVITKTKKLLWKDGMCYYSKEKYNNSINIDNNVVGPIKQMQKFVKDNNLPVSYQDFKKYSNDTEKLFNFESKLQQYFHYILSSNVNDLFYFSEYSNITTFSIFGFDIEFDKNYNPVIYEGNYYFARFDTKNQYGKIIKNLYEDIFTELKLSNITHNGFYEL
jgi:hypothetical protein